jgi:hypothetical protein
LLSSKGSFPNQGSLEFRRRAQDVQHKPRAPSHLFDCPHENAPISAVRGFPPKEPQMFGEHTDDLIDSSRTHLGNGFEFVQQVKDRV